VKLVSLFVHQTILINESTGRDSSKSRNIEKSGSLQKEAHRQITGEVLKRMSSLIIILLLLFVYNYFILIKMRSLINEPKFVQTQ